MKLLVCGASGYIGARVLALARSRGFDAVGTAASERAGLARLDLSRPETFDSGGVGALGAGDVLVLLAAISQPDVCAREPERTAAVNVGGSIALATLALRRGARVLFCSSDTVYGEREHDFDETAAANPHGAYAAQKHQVEVRFADVEAFKSLRLSYVFSREDRFTQQLAACATQGRVAEIFEPFARAVVHRDDVVQALLALAAAGRAAPGAVLNVGGPEVLSRAAFSRVLRAHALPTLGFDVVPAPAGFFVNRPRAIAMRSPLLAGVLGRPATALAQAAAIEFQSTGEARDA